MNLIHEARALTEDGELIRRAAEGDEAAFRHIYESHRTGLFRFAYRLLGSVEAAEDTVQDCFLSLIRQPHAYDDQRGSLRMYLYGVARHFAFKRLRHAGIETTLDDTDDDDSHTAIPAPHASPLGKLIDEELANMVRDEIERLPPLQREALILFEYEELTLSNIAAIVGAEVGTVKARLHRARAKLRTRLAKHFGREEQDEASESVEIIGI